MKNGIWKQAAVTLTAVIITLVTSYFAFAGGQAELMTTIRERLTRLETQMEQLIYIVKQDIENHHNEGS
jgi:hypothetical protein